MISDPMLIFLIGMLILLIINIIGYTRMPLLSIVGILGTALVAIDTIAEFGDYWAIAVVLILVNVIIPISGLTRTFGE